MQRVLASAARLQEVVPDAVLVGGSAAARYAGHRDSFDHDHVLTDLVDRYELVLDVVALADHLGSEAAVAALAPIDDYYADRSGEPGSVLTALVAALADPQPRDTEVIDELPRYKGLAERWHRWDDVVEACQELALRLSGAV